MIEIRFLDLGPLQAWLSQCEFQAKNMRQPLMEAKDAFEEAIDDVFDAEGPGWAKLRPWTEAKRGAPGPILDESGSFRDSWKTGGPDHVEVWTGDTLETGSALRQAMPHEKGFRNRGTFPGAPAAGLPPHRMSGQPVAARPVLRSLNEAQIGRIADRMLNKFLSLIGL